MAKQRCAFNQYHMGITAENVAAKFGIDRHFPQNSGALFFCESQSAAASVRNALFVNALLALLGRRHARCSHLPLQDQRRMLLRQHLRRRRQRLSRPDRRVDRVLQKGTQEAEDQAALRFSVPD